MNFFLSYLPMLSPASASVTMVRNWAACPEDVATAIFPPKWVGRWVGGRRTKERVGGRKTYLPRRLPVSQTRR